MRDRTNFKNNQHKDKPSGAAEQAIYDLIRRMAHGVCEFDKEFSEKRRVKKWEYLQTEKKIIFYVY